MNNQRRILYFCCVPLVNENEKINKLKPFLLASLLILLIVICLDYFIFETKIYIYISISIFPFFILIVKRFYYMYTINIVYFIFMIFPKIINDIGSYFQIGIRTSSKIIILCLKIFCFILLILVQYFFYIYYKELRYQFIIERPEEKHLKDVNYDDSEYEKFIITDDKKLCNIINENNESND